MSIAQKSTHFDRYVESHKNPQGPNDARPTALQIIQDENLIGKFTNKTILVTGGSSGIGIETIRALAHTGAHIVIGVRDVKKGQNVINDIITRDNIVKAEQLELLEMDLDSLDSIRTAAATFLTRHDKLNILINNAGIGGVPEGRTADGFESHIGVNHLAHFLLFNLFRPILVFSSTPTFSSRVVSVASAMHRFGAPDLSNLNWTSEAPDQKYNAAKAYGASKTANIWFTNELERRYGTKDKDEGKGGRLHAISLHPGGMETGLQQHHSVEFLEMFEGIVAENPDLKKTYKSVEQGAATTVVAAVAAELEGKGGFYLEDCAVAPLWTEKEKVYAPGYMGYVFDEKKERELWALSCQLVGVKDD